LIADKIMANYALVENNEITERYDLLPKAWRNISGFDLLKDDKTMLVSLGWYTVTKANQPYDQSLQYISGYTYEFTGDAVIENPVFTNIVIVPPKSQEELFQEALDALRIKRDQLISLSDWTQLVDVQTIHDDEWKAQWASYRQQLRDLPNRCILGEINIYEVEWPVLVVIEPVIAEEPVVTETIPTEEPVVTDAVPTEEPVVTDAVVTEEPVVTDAVPTEEP
jgi:hypothetical protein